MFGKKLLFLLLMIAMIPLATTQSWALPINLSSWDVVQYDLTGNMGPGNWVLSNNNETVTQTANADPTMYLNGINQTSYQMRGSWGVTDPSDDDHIGFVFGYQDASNFYVMDWKQSFQESFAGIAQEGFSIKKFSAGQKSDFFIEDFHRSANTTNKTILASSFGSTEGWADNTLYDFFLDFQPGTFNIQVSLGNTILWDVTVNDNSFTSGQFGFYNLSQSSVQYSGFEQTGGTVIPEPSTIALFSIGLVGMFGFLRKRRKA